MIIDELIFTRSIADVNRLKQLAVKGWHNMTEEERNEYLTSIGAYAATDINRVGAAQIYLRDIFNEFPQTLSTYLENAKQTVLNSLKANTEHYTLNQPLLADEYKEVSYAHPVALEAVKLDWACGDYPATFTDEAERVYDIGYYLENLAVLRAILTMPNGVPSVPQNFWNAPTYTGANEIEQILYEIYKAYVAYTNGKVKAIDDAEKAEIDYYDRANRTWLYSAEVLCGEA